MRPPEEGGVETALGAASVKTWNWPPRGKRLARWFTARRMDCSSSTTAASSPRTKPRSHGSGIPSTN
jgi:hypothetical protein